MKAVNNLRLTKRIDARFVRLAQKREPVFCPTTRLVESECDAVVVG